MAEFDYPDDRTGKPPAPQGTTSIDFTATAEDKHVIVCEHTIIESQEEQLNEARQMEEMPSPVAARAIGQLAVDRFYRLALDLGAVVLSLALRVASPSSSASVASVWWITDVKRSFSDLPVGSQSSSARHAPANRTHRDHERTWWRMFRA